MNCVKYTKSFLTFLPLSLNIANNKTLTELDLIHRHWRCLHTLNTFRTFLEKNTQLPHWTYNNLIENLCIDSVDCLFEKLHEKLCYCICRTKNSIQIMLTLKMTVDDKFKILFTDIRWLFYKELSTRCWRTRCSGLETIFTFRILKTSSTNTFQNIQEIQGRYFSTFRYISNVF